MCINAWAFGKSGWPQPSLVISNKTAMFNYSWNMLTQTWLFQIPFYFKLKTITPWICPPVI